MALDRAVLLNVLMYSQQEICKIYRAAIKLRTPYESVGTIRINFEHCGALCSGSRLGKTVYAMR